MNTDWGVSHNCQLASHILECYGVPLEQARRNADFAHLYDESQRFCTAPTAYVERLRSLSVVRLGTTNFVSVLEQCLAELRQRLHAGEPPHLIAEALQIATSDVLLIEEIRGYGAPTEVVTKLCDQLVAAALYTAERLVINVGGSLHAQQRHLAEVIDEHKVCPLGDGLKDDDATIEGKLDIAPGRPLLVIATAGRGTRGRTTIPKALLPLGGQPLVRGIIDGARAVGIKDIVLVLKHGAELHPPVLGSEFTYVRQREALGTGHSFAAALRHYAQHAGACVLSYSDTPFLTPDSFAQVLAPVTAGEATMAVLAVSSQAMPELGQLKEDDGRVRLIGQPRFGFQDLGRADGGLYALALREGVPALLATENRNHRYEYSFTEIVAELDARGHKVQAIPVNDPREVLGINRPADLMLARRVLHELHADLQFYAGLGAAVRSDLTPPELLEFTNRCDQQLHKQIGALFALDDLLAPVRSDNI